MKVGFIGLGNVGGKLAGSLLRNGYDLMVRDLDREVAQPFVDAGDNSTAVTAKWCVGSVDLPSPVFRRRHAC